MRSSAELYVVLERECGELAPGTSLETHRELAGRLYSTTSRVSHALRELAKAGFVARPGQRRSAVVAAREDRWRETPRELALEIERRLPRERAGVGTPLDPDTIRGWLDAPLEVIEPAIVRLVTWGVFRVQPPPEKPLAVGPRLKPPRKLASAVADLLGAAIQRGELRAGEPLEETPVATRYEIDVRNARAAIQLVVLRGLGVRLNRKVLVAKPHEAQMSEINGRNPHA